MPRPPPVWAQTDPGPCLTAILLELGHVVSAPEPRARFSLMERFVQVSGHCHETNNNKNSPLTTQKTLSVPPGKCCPHHCHSHLGLMVPCDKLSDVKIDTLQRDGILYMCMCGGAWEIWRCVQFPPERSLGRMGQLQPAQGTSQ